MRLSNTLATSISGTDSTVVCQLCAHPFGPLSRNWKLSALLIEEPMHQLGMPYSTGEEVILRLFCCPGCGTVLETETALAGDPVLEDVMFDD